MSEAATKGLQHPKHDGHGDADPHGLAVDFAGFSPRHQAHETQGFVVEASAEAAHHARVVQAAFGVNGEREVDPAREAAVEGGGIIEPADQEFQQNRVAAGKRRQLIGEEVSGGVDRSSGLRAVWAATAPATTASNL